MLQSEVNPHFIYNTLNSIRWMATIQHAPGIAEMVTAFARLTKSISKGTQKLVPLQEELALLNDYFTIQQYRYGGDLEIEVSRIEDERLCRDCMIPRFTLQPLVENAIRYGLGEKGKIAIQAFFDKKRNLIAVTIEDFGHGLSQKEIDEINEPFGYRWNTGKENRGIGIRYVKAMLSTFYQGNADLFVNSKRGTGTKITIILPAAKEVDEHECFDRR